MMEKIIINKEELTAFDVIKNYCANSKLLMMRFYAEYHSGKMSEGNESLNKYFEIICNTLDSDDYMKLCLGEYQVELSKIQQAEYIVKEYGKLKEDNVQDDEIFNRYSNRYHAAKEILELWKGDRNDKSK